MTGNPIHEVLSAYAAQIRASDVCRRLDVEPRRVFLVTLHRAENVDDPARLAQLSEALSLVAEYLRHADGGQPAPAHADQTGPFGLGARTAQVRFLDPWGSSISSRWSGRPSAC